MDSTLGSVSLSPYSEDDDANTKRWTFASRAATRRLTVPPMFTAFVDTGSRTERWTDGIAA